MRNKVKIYKFPSGATILYRHFSYGNASAVYAGFHCGNEYGEGGMAHCFEHLLFQGTKNRTAEEILDEKSKKCFINAVTYKYFMFVNFYASNRKLLDGLDLSSDVLLNSTFSQDEIKKEVEVIKQERESFRDKILKDIYYQHDFIFTQQIYDDIDHACRKNFGTDEFLDNLKTADFVEFRKKNYTKNKFLFVCCSTLPFFKIKRLCKKYFLDKIENDKKAEILDFKLSPITAKEGLFVANNDNKTVRGILSIKMDCEDGSKFDFDYNPNLVRWNFVVKPELYFHKLRELGLVYSASSHFVNHRVKNFSFCFEFETSSIENVDKIMEVIGDSISIVKEKGISDEDVEAFRYNWITADDIPHVQDNRSRAVSMINGYHMYREKNPFLNVPNRVFKKAMLKANRETANEFIQKMFDSKNDIYLTVMGDFDKSKLKTIEEYKKMIFK